MANTESAKKRIRQDLKKTQINKARMNRLRTSVRRVEDLLNAGKKVEAEAAFVKAQSVIAETAQKGTIHKNAANRKISRLSLRVKKSS
ncbi:MAG: 30S ribosomal protein S20 [Alphaproteobacteria bacterium]|jgi:small subunit ribosomal protein S20|nr:30S ribosomal protein S20 [Alphaproteobacteria bacterium]